MGLPIVLLVLNNGILGYQKHAEEVKFGEHTKAVNFTSVDHAAIARACGVEGIRLEDSRRIRETLLSALATPRPGWRTTTATAGRC